MIETILHTVKLFAAMVPFLLLVLLNGKTNLKREIRSRQALMPILTLAYCIVLAIFFNTVGGWVNRLVSLVIGLLQSLGSRLGQSGSPLSGVLAGILGKITDKIRALRERIDDLRETVGSLEAELDGARAQIRAWEEAETPLVSPMGADYVSFLTLEADPSDSGIEAPTEGPVEERGIEPTDSQPPPEPDPVIDVYRPILIAGDGEMLG